MHKRKKITAEAQFKMRPVCGGCGRVFAAGARKAGFPVCVMCRRKEKEWTRTTRTLPLL